MRQKGSQYWRRTLDSSSLSSTQVWKQLDKLLGRGRGSLLSPGFSAEDYHSYIDKKIHDIRERTTGAGPVVFTEYSGPSMTKFSAPTIGEVKAIVRSSPNKQCATDPLPTWLLKDSIDTLAPFLTALLSTSLEHGEFPSG